MKTGMQFRLQSSSSGRQQAFSLIELLIVVTIIMILAGLLLPALRGVRERAKAVACLANLKDIGSALLLYEQEYSEFPGRAPTNTKELYGYGVGGQTGSSSSNPAWGSDLAWDLRPINRYMINQGAGAKAVKSFRCLSDKGDPYSPVGNSVNNGWEEVGNSYFYATSAGALHGDDFEGMVKASSPYQGLRRSAIVAPARKIMMCEESFLINRDCNNVKTRRHFFKSTSSGSGAPPFPQSNVLFADGSARYVTRDRGPNTGTGCSAPSAWPTNNTIPSPEHDWY